MVCKMAERSFYFRPVEEAVLHRISIQEFVSELTPEQFDLLWDLSNDEKPTIRQLIDVNSFSLSQLRREMYLLRGKAEVNIY